MKKRATGIPTAAEVLELLDRCKRGQQVVFEAGDPHVERYRIFAAQVCGTSSGGLPCDEILTFNGWMQLRRYGYAKVYIA